MNYAIWVLGIILFMLVNSLTNLTSQTYSLQEKLYKQVKAYNFDDINDLNKYFPCERQTTDGDTKFWYCFLPEKVREVFIPWYSIKDQSFTVVRNCGLDFPNCKNQIVDNWFLYYPWGTILWCQVGLEGYIKPNMVWVSDLDKYILRLKTTQISNDLESDELRIEVTVGSAPLVEVFYNNIDIWSKTVASFTNLDSEDLLKNMLDWICTNGGVAKRCVVHDNLNIVLNKFNFYISDEDDALLIDLIETDYRLTSVTLEVEDAVPTQSSSTYWKSLVLESCNK